MTVDKCSYINTMSRRRSLVHSPKWTAKAGEHPFARLQVHLAEVYFLTWNDLMASLPKTVKCYHSTKHTMTISGFSFGGIWKRVKLVHKIWAPSFYYMNTNSHIIKYKATTVELKEGYCLFSPIFLLHLTKTPENVVQLFILYTLVRNLNHWNSL